MATKNPLMKVKHKLALRTRARRLFARKGSEYIVFESAVSLVFFTLAFLVFVPLLRRDSAILDLLVVIYGAFVIVWAFSTIYDYLIKASRLLINRQVANYSLLSALNTVLGLALPLFVINSVSYIVMNTLGGMPHMGSALCEIRMSFVRFYNAANIYNQLNSLVFWTLVFSLGLLVLGGLVERMNRK